MIFLGADHRGFRKKNQLKQWLADNKIPFKDLGAYQCDLHDDFPDYAKLVVQNVVSDPNNKGVLLCGSGAGMSIASNKVSGIQAAIGFTHQQVRSFVEDDKVNVLCIAADYTSKFKVFQLVKTFVKAQYQHQDRQVRRMKKIATMGELSNLHL